MSNSTVPNLGFSLPYEIAVVRPLKRTTAAEREAALQAAHYNTELISQEWIYLDLSTDSGVSAISTAQLPALAGGETIEPGMGLAPEGSRAFRLFSEAMENFLGFPYAIPVTQGRAAERIWTKIHVKPTTFILGNMLFPSTRLHIEFAGAKIIDVISDSAHDLQADTAFKGDVDIDKVTAALREHGREKISCIYVELAVNACGGHPVSLANLQTVRSVATEHGIPLFLDACRILENSALLQRRETSCRNRTVQEIVRATCSLADGLTMSGLKDLLVPVGGLIATRDRGSYQKAMMQSFFDGVQAPPGAMQMMASGFSEILSTDAYAGARIEQVESLWRRLSDELPVTRPAGGHGVFIDCKRFMSDMAAKHHPAEALAAYIYSISGIRVSKGPPPAPSQAQRGIELLRLAVPARKYLPQHIDDIAEAFRYAFAHRREIPPLKRLETPERMKYAPSYFARV